MHDFDSRANSSTFIHDDFITFDSRYLFNVDYESGIINFQQNILDQYPDYTGGSSYRFIPSLDEKNIVAALDCGCISSIKGSELFKFNVETLEFETIFRINNDGNYKHHFNPQAVWKNSNNEVLIYFTDLKVEDSSLNESTDLICYNYTLGKIEWQVNDWTRYPSASGPAQIDEESTALIIQGAGTSTLFSFNLLNGQENWRTNNIINSFSNYIISEGKVLLGSDAGGFYIVNKFTGNIEGGEHIEGAGTIKSIAAMNGKVNHNKITVFDIATGAFEFQIRAESKSFGEGIITDSENNLIYAITSDAAYCFKIPE